MFGDKGVIRVLMVLVVMIVFHGRAEARNSLKFDGFRANMEDIIKGLADYCQRHPGEWAIDIPVADANIHREMFRKSCGTGLNGKRLPFGDWGVIYREAPYMEGRRSIFGVGKQFSFAGRNYLVVIGQELFVRYPGQLRQSEILVPAARLNRGDGSDQNWQEILNYVSANGASWNVRSGSLADFSPAVRVPDANVHAIWQQIVVGDFAKLVRTMKDMDWPN